MNHIQFSSIVVFGLLLHGLYGQSPTADPAASFSQESLVLERSDTTIRMNADGTGERSIHVTVRIQSQGAAQTFGVLGFSYASASETPHIVFVRVHKPDGTTVDTPVSDAIDMPAEVTREAPVYSDLKEKHVPVRSLSVGDTLEYQLDTSIDKAEAPGQFWGATHFTAPGTVVVLAETLTLEVPMDKYVQVWSPNHKPEISEKAGVRTYKWVVPQLIPAPRNTADQDSTKIKPPKDPDEDADNRKLPSVAWTTFHSWAEVGDWYRSLSSARTQPTDDLRKRADEITKDAKSPEDQLRAIYEFVSMKTRYVGIDFGVGRYQPHAAAEVLANQYGDCKDKDTLLESMLRAKGFSTAPALIGAGIALVPDVPTPALFNHVITTVNLPSGRIWLDSTPGASPFRYLSAIIRDQRALVVSDVGPATLESTPADAPYPFIERFEAVGSLDADGKLTAKMSANYRDDNEIVLRSLARNLAPAEWDKASQFVSSATGFGGTTSNTQFKGVEDVSIPITLNYDYARHPFGDWDSRRIVPLFPVLEFTALDRDGIAPAEDIDLGAPRTLVAITHIRLPEGYRTDLPDPIHVKTGFATFDKTYRFDGKEILVERTIVVLQKKVAKADWKKYQSFTKDIGIEGEPWIQLLLPVKTIVIKLPAESALPPGKNTTLSVEKNEAITAPSAPTKTSDAMPGESVDSGGTASELVRQAGAQLQAHDLSGAKETLEKAKAKNPSEPGLWGLLGIIAQFQRNSDEAIASFKKELAAHPDNASFVRALALQQKGTGQVEEAQNTVQAYLDRHPENLQLSTFLAGLQSAAGDYAGALKTLQAAAEQAPDNRDLRIQMSDFLIHLNRMDEAAAAAKSAVDGTEDPLVLNNAAYELTESGIDLPYAESMSRKSIDKLEEKSATITTAEVNSRAFDDAETIIASWDTLGWILFREGKLEESKPLLIASWRNDLRPEVGDHLGQLYEAMNKPDDAAKIYSLAEAAVNTVSTPPDIRNHIRDSIARLRAAGAKPGPNNGVLALQDLRTYKVPRPAGASGWGTFRIEITSSGALEAQQMSGEHQMAGAIPVIQKMKFPELVPPDSKAHLLRSAVVSCSGTENCEVVLVPQGSLQTEQQ